MHTGRGVASIAIDPPVTFQGLARVSAWSKHPWLRAGFSTRLGGESYAYGEGDLNLGWTQSDDPANVSRNRERFLAAVGVPRTSQLFTLRQFHSNLVRHVDGAAFLSVHGDQGYVLRGDGLVSDAEGVALGVQTADCVPVLVADVRQQVIGAFHAGWRGTLGRIVQRGVGDFLVRYGSRAEDLIAAIGPCIGLCCFAVGDEVRGAFRSQFAYADELFCTGLEHTALRTQDRQGQPTKQNEARDKLRMDLVEANRRQLLDAGVAEAAISVIGECTACSRTVEGRRRYFSHRAEQGFTGRMLSVIAVDSAR